MMFPSWRRRTDVGLAKFAHLPDDLRIIEDFADFGHKFSRRVGGSAFDDCEKVTEVIFRGKNNRAYNICSHAFSDVKVETIALPEGLETIEFGAFFGMQRASTKKFVPSFGYTNFRSGLFSAIIT